MSDIQEEQKKLYKRAEENDLLIEIKKYKEIEKYLIKENEILQDRINKAIAYLESNEHTCNYVDIYNYALREEDLLNILKGDNK